MEQGLDADPVVTADAARILRIPNTHNFKATPALDVEVLSMGTGLVDLDVFAAKLHTNRYQWLASESTQSKTRRTWSKRWV